MPSSARAASGKRRPPRCSYKEGGRRCVRDGVGDPPLCRVHQVVFAEIGRTPQPGRAVTDLFDDIMSGQRPSRDRVRDAAEEFVRWGIGGGIAQGYHPPVDARGTDHQGQRAEGSRWYDSLIAQLFGQPGAQPGDAQRHTRPPNDPAWQQREVLQAARRRARLVFGFAATERLEADKVKERYRLLCRKYHPDTAGADASRRAALTEKMTEVNVSADILRDEIEANGP